MKKKIFITASFDRPDLVESIAAVFASRQYETGFVKPRLQGEWQPINTSSIENYVTGNFEITYGETDLLRIPFITCFLFSCTKEKNNPYKMGWSFSLS